MVRPAAVGIALCLFVLCVLSPRNSVAQNSSPSEITVAAAADLTDALKEIATEFEKKTGNRVRLVFGSSGNLASQIRNGAPFDVFLSADMDYPRSLAKDGLADESTLAPYATGTLAVLVRAGSNISIESRGLHALLDTSVKRVAIANPAHAPYGRAAESMLKNAKLYDPLKSKLVVGENVAQATQFVLSGNAQAGIVSRSQALVASRGGAFRLWIPPSVYPPITQGAVVLSKSHKRDVASRFQQYLTGPEAARILVQYGFASPGNAGQQDEK